MLRRLTRKFHRRQLPLSLAALLFALPWPALLRAADEIRGVPPAPAHAATLPSRQEIDSILQELSVVTGFRIHKELPFQSITREQVNDYLKEQIRESVKPDEIAAEEATLKKFGFVPPEFDLKQNTIDLLTEQAAAFYDYHRRKLFISDWATENMRDIALIHELAHALADQNFSIRKFLGKSSENDEASLARQAVVEGQASWLMVEVAARRAGRTLANPADAHEFLEAAEQSSDPYPVFDNAPLYIRRTLLFPYEDGERFQQAVFLHDGEAGLTRVFREPPVSSSQIIHPERYFDGTAPTDPVLPKPIKGAKGWVLGSLSELETGILLEQYGSAELAAELAPKLKGANYRLDQIREPRQPHAKRTMLTLVSEWDNAADAARFFDAYKKVMRTKWKSIEAGADSETRFAGKADDGYFALTREGAKVTTREGFAALPD